MTERSGLANISKAFVRPRRHALYHQMPRLAGRLELNIPDGPLSRSPGTIGKDLRPRNAPTALQWGQTPRDAAPTSAITGKPGCVPTGRSGQGRVAADSPFRWRPRWKPAAVAF